MFSNSYNIYLLEKAKQNKKIKFTILKQIKIQVNIYKLK